MSALTVSKEDEKRVKGMGFLNNRGTDLFSARVLTVNGKVTAAQHRCMADAGREIWKWKSSVYDKTFCGDTGNSL